jgi:serine/threonine-protein kinase
MPTPDTDKNLLFGVLALQADLLDAKQFVEACTLWANEKHRPLADLLVERGWLTPEEKEHVEFLLERKLKRHGGDAHTSLATVAHPEVRRALDTIDDPDVEQSLASLAMDGHASELPTVDAHPVAGRYHVLRPHARGGLGEVFVALDTELNREVALKEIQAQYAQDPHSRSRFLLEAEVTGGLEHPSIVPVYGLGQYEDGRPCYAMRFVRGETFQDAIRRFHEADVPGRDTGERSLAFRALLNRFVAVCNAVAYAHSRGILHRDLKPANVMLGRYGETLVVDWGLAKAVGRQDSPSGGDEPALRPASAEGLATQMGTVLGTPAYASPEQAAGRLDLLGPASDIYSLGATLYSVLTGRAPFEGSDKGQVLRQVGRGAWRPALHLKKGTPAALDAICRKAMSLQPQDRYGSALALAADLEHWLADEPTAAYRDPPLTRLRRWGRRHRTVVATAVALLLTAVAGLALGLVAVEHERQRTVRERNDKELALTAATAAREAEARAREQALAALRMLSEKELRQERARRGQLTAEDRDFLRKLLKHYEGFAAFRGDNAESHAIRAEGYSYVSLVRNTLGEFREAEAANRAALRLYQQLAAEHPEYREQLALNLANLGRLLQLNGQPKEAEATFRVALEQFQRFAAPAFRQGVALTQNGLGVLLQEAGRPGEAEAAYREAVRLRKQLAAEFPSVSAYHCELAQSLGNLARLLCDGREFTSARRLLEEAMPHHQAMLQENLRSDFYHGTYCSNLDTSVRILAGHRDPTAAVRTAVELRDLGWEPAADAYCAACALAACVAIVEKDGQLAPELRRQQAQTYADQGLAMLRHAVASGYKDVDHIRKDKDLDPLRSRADFKELLAQLEQGKAAHPK